jgi:hypothetical protein
MSTMAAEAPPGVTKARRRRAGDDPVDGARDPYLPSDLHVLACYRCGTTGSGALDAALTAARRLARALRLMLNSTPVGDEPAHATVTPPSTGDRGTGVVASRHPRTGRWERANGR